MTLNTGDAAFYNDRSKPTSTASPDLAGPMPLDGQVATGPNTSSRFLAPVGLTDSSTAAAPAAACDASGKPCDFITAKFNADKEATYTVRIHNGNMYLTTGDGETRPVNPQAFHPSNQDEFARRDSNYYSQQDNSWNTEAPPPPQQSFAYGPPQYGPRQYYGQNEYQPRHFGMSPGQAILDIGLGLLTHGRSLGFGGYQNYRHDYRPMPYGVVGYNPDGFMPVASNGWNGGTSWNGGYSYNNNNNGNNWNGGGWQSRPRYYAPPPQVAYNDGVNPQYTSGDYPGTFYDS